MGANAIAETPPDREREGSEIAASGATLRRSTLQAAELPEDDPRPLHGPNLFPPEQDAPGLRAAVLEYMDEMSALARALLRAIYKSLEVPEDHYEALFEEPTTLFRCFSYPPNDEKWGAKSYAAARLGPRRRRRGWDRVSAVAAAAATRPRPRDATRSTGRYAVGEHSDYGFLTILKQDESGGLQVKDEHGEWTDARRRAGSTKGYVASRSSPDERARASPASRTSAIPRRRRRSGATRPHPRRCRPSRAPSS